MPGFSNRSTLHSRLTAFVDWIATDSSTEDAIRRQSEEIRTRIKAKAVDDGLTVRSTPNSGSFAKRTGLRRHLHGDSEVEGQDVDLPFVVSPKTKDAEQVDRLLDRFMGYAKASYPDTPREKTKSSVRLSFVGTRLSYDLVPMLATQEPEEQILFRADGERRRTSVQKHITFMTSRTGTSNELPGRVKFNECVRLMKWWREFRVGEAGSLHVMPSLVVDLLSAKAYDAVSVRVTYGETLAAWFGFLANLVQKRSAVTFTDFERAPIVPQATWVVLDPVNHENNTVSSWTGLQIDELAEWLAAGRDDWGRAIGSDLRGDDGASLDALVALFGSPFRHHHGDK